MAPSDEAASPLARGVLQTTDVTPSILAELELSGRPGHVLIARFPWLIGSGAHADLRLDDRSITRSHALLLWCHERGAVRVVDLNSTNGTRVNGRRIRECLLTPGVTLQFGAVGARFRLRWGMSTTSVGADPRK